MTVNFGRPDINKIVSLFKPDEAYYCGGSILKHQLRETCAQYNVPLFAEDFDEAPKTLNAIYQSVKNMISALRPSTNIIHANNAYK